MTARQDTSAGPIMRDRVEALRKKNAEYFWQIAGELHRYEQQAGKPARMLIDFVQRTTRKSYEGEDNYTLQRRREINAAFEQYRQGLLAALENLEGGASDAWLDAGRNISRTQAAQSPVLP